MRASGNPMTLVIQKYFEYAKYIPIFRNYYYKLKNASTKLFEFYRRQIEEHKKYINPDSEPTDFVEAFLKEKAKREVEGTNEFYR